MIALFIECPCGYRGEVKDIGSDFRVTGSYTNESGTSWPGEIEITCPSCGGVDDSRTC